MPPPDRLRPYLAAFRSRFLQMLQYRTAAYAGFATQCWWGGIKIMILAAFYGGAAAASAPMSLAQSVTYTWMAQGLLALLPWGGDPEIALSVRTGAVAYDRLRPVDAYALWFARSAGWAAARAAARGADAGVRGHRAAPWPGSANGAGSRLPAWPRARPSCSRCCWRCCCPPRS